MSSGDQQAELEKSAEEVRNFPLRRLYYLVIFILTLLSPIGLSIETENFRSLPWKVSADIQITSITITFLILAWVPLLIPWLISMSPRLQSFLMGIRESGIEEIEAGILRIKLNPAIKEAAEIYRKAADPKTDPNQLENSYKEALATIAMSDALSPADAIKKIDEVCSYYDRIRQTLPSGPRRTRLLTELASILWTLMSRVNLKDLDIRERLLSPSGGKRLSAYKYLEYAPDVEYLNLLLSRAVGVLEEPFGQYSALLALRRLAVNVDLDASQKELILRHLRWSVELEYMGDDRIYLMNSILTRLQKH